MDERVEERPSESLGLRELLTDAIRYWERRRWVNNAALVVVVLTCFALQGPSVWTRLTLQTVLVIFINAVVANIAYCAAYPVDVVLQFSCLREAWCRRRGYLLTVGILFASAITYLVSSALSVPEYGD
jgi:hypothetical protein